MSVSSHIKEHAILGIKGPTDSLYIPYTGATANVDLGDYDLTADIIIGNEIRRIRGATITRNSDGKITQVAFTGGRTVDYTIDSYGKCSSYTDGTYTWTITRDANGGKPTSWAVT